EDIPRRGTAAEPLDLDRVGRAGALDLLAARVDQRADSARVCADDDRVSLLQGAVLDQHGRDGASPAVQPALDDHAPGCTVRVGFELQDLGLERGHLEELVDARPLLRRRRDVDRLAPPLLRDEAMVGELTLDALGIGLGLVHLVHDDEDRHVRRSRVVDRLDGLRHDAVVGGHHEDDDVGRLGAAGAHRRERLVPWRVQERNLAVPSLDLVGADVLRDPPDFRRIFSASSLTVTDSGTRISSRLTSAGGAGVSTAAAAAAAGAGGAAGRPGAATAAAGWAGRAGAGRSGAAATRGGANSVAG